MNCSLSFVFCGLSDLQKGYDQVDSSATSGSDRPFVVYNALRRLLCIDMIDTDCSVMWIGPDHRKLNRFSL